jgi:hypothetical protein
MPLHILPPSKPKYDGRVESRELGASNRVMREEFYGNDKLLKPADSLGAFRNKLKEFIRVNVTTIELIENLTT